MKCENCGEPIAKIGGFCGACGHKSVVEESFREATRGQDQMTSNAVYSNHNSKSFFKFENMITPSIIQIIFYISLAVSAIVSLGILIAGWEDIGPLAFILAVITFGALALSSRIYCELLIVIFKIHESLIDIRNK